MKVNYITLLLVLVIIIVSYYLYKYATDSPYRISAQEAKALIGDGQVDLVLDVRTQLERDTLGFYPGSVHIPSADLENRMRAEYPNTDITILAYCNTGHRARMATEKLHALGYTRAFYIATGYGSLL